MTNSYAVHPVALSAGQKFHAIQSCLYSNQIRHVTSEQLGEERCAFVRVEKGGIPGIYAKEQLSAVRFLPKEWAPFFQDKFISESQLVALISDTLHALRQRKTIMVTDPDEALRWVHGDADGLPGIVVDDYGPVVVIQSGSTAGDFLFPLVVSALSAITTQPLFERSSGQVRAIEKLPERTRWLRTPPTGEALEQVQTFLAGTTLHFRPLRCQKTGLFLDQRENLLLLKKFLSKGTAKNMLDLCSYAGAWSCAAAQCGVREFTAVDQDKDALQLCEMNIGKNTKSENPSPSIELLHGDLFELLSKLNREKKSYDVVVADPPAFTKSAKHVPEARRAYQRLAKMSSRLVASGGLLVACSCSRHIGEEEFYEIVSGALDHDDWIYLGRGRQSPDHTVLATDKHSLYLKALFFARRSALSQFQLTHSNKGEMT
jgi:23S rRNA (cytosine1962-C5)-methyltransferase